MATQTGFSGAAHQNGAAARSAGGFDVDEISGEDTSTPLGVGVTVITALLNRPLLVGGVLAAALGALIGIWLANQTPRRSAMTDKASDAVEQAAGWSARRARRARERAGEVGAKAGSRSPEVGTQLRAGMALAPLAMRLLANPMVQAYVRRMVVRQLSSRLGR